MEIMSSFIVIVIPEDSWILRSTDPEFPEISNMKSRRCGDQKRSTRKVENRGKLENYKAEKSREQFQLCTHKRLIDIYSSNSKAVDALMKLELASGVEVEIKV